MAFMNLSDTEQKEYEQKILELEKLPIMSEEQQTEYKSRWTILCCQHFSELRLVLDHVGRLPILEASNDGMTHLSMKDYLNQYSDTELLVIRHQIAQARRALNWLEIEVDESQNSKKNG